MSTIEKALSLLDFFDDKTPEYGVSDLARASGLDKATAHRLLGALARCGFVEQDPRTRAYRLGAEILRLARVRESCFPTIGAVQSALAKLSEATGETCHASLFSAGFLATIGVVESLRATRVFIDPGLKLPPHATASGLAFLAYAPQEAVSSVLSGELRPFTPNTLTDPAAVRAAVDSARAQGYGVYRGGFEIDVHSVAAPLFGPTGAAVGALSVATPASRFDSASVPVLGLATMRAALEATAGLGGRPDQSFAALCERAAP